MDKKEREKMMLGKYIRTRFREKQTKRAVAKREQDARRLDESQAKPILVKKNKID